MTGAPGKILVFLMAHPRLTVAVCEASFTCELKVLTPAAFEDYFSKWSARFGKCIEAEGEYFEADHVLLPE